MKKIIFIVGIMCIGSNIIFAQTQKNQNLFYSQIGYKTNISNLDADNLSLNYLSINYVYSLKNNVNIGMGFSSGSRVYLNFNHIFTNIVTAKELELKFGYEFNIKQKIYFHTILNVGFIGLGSSIHNDTIAQVKADAYTGSVFLKPQIIVNYQISKNIFLGLSYQYQYNTSNILSSFYDYSVIAGVKF